MTKPALEQCITVRRETRRPIRPFADTNVLLYLLSSDTRKADIAESLLADGLTIGVQVLNEFANVSHRKFGMLWPEVGDVLGLIRSRSVVKPSTADVHDMALGFVQQHALAWYDALIVAAAADAGCVVLYSEDMQHGQKITDTLTIRNPFVSPATTATG